MFVCVCVCGGGVECGLWGGGVRGEGAGGLYVKTITECETVK